MLARMSRPLVFVMALALSACAVPKTSRFTDAASTPLNDFNLVQAPIPQALIDARQRLYKPPADPSCAALAAELRGLDEVLGPDLDAPATASNPGLVERGGELMGDAAVGAVRNTAESIVPFRSWVRKLTGAERYSKDVAAAIAAGAARRSFLRGLGSARGCN